jgi:hypothetical protein
VRDFAYASLQEQRATIHRERLAGDIAVTNQQHDGLRDLVASADAADGRVRRFPPLSAVFPSRCRPRPAPRR